MKIRYFSTWSSCNTRVRYFSHGFIHRDITFMCLQYSRLLIYHLMPNVWKASYTINAYIFVDVLHWPPYNMHKFISCVVPGPSQWFFHFGQEIAIAWTHIGCVRWMFRISHCQRRKSGVTTCIVMNNSGVLYHQVSSFSPERWTKVVLQERAAVGCLGGTAWCSITPSVSYAHEHHFHSTLCGAHLLWTRWTGMLPFTWLEFQVWFIWARQVSSIATIRPRNSSHSFRYRPTRPVWLHIGAIFCKGNFLGIQRAAILR